MYNNKTLKLGRLASLVVITFFIAGIFITGMSDLAFAKEKKIRVLAREQQGKSIEVLN